MNGRRAKQIRGKALLFLVEWLQCQVTEEEAKKINLSNIRKLVPSDTHIYANSRIILSAYSFKWFSKVIKLLIKYNKYNINNIQLKDIEDYLNKERRGLKLSI